MPLRKTESIALNDRFFLGGPLGLRGFSNRGAGPHKEGITTFLNFFYVIQNKYLQMFFLNII